MWYVSTRMPFAFVNVIAPEHVQAHSSDEKCPITNGMQQTPLHLSATHTNLKGWLWSRLALTAANFVIEAEFKISGDSSHLYGDGLALWLTTDRAQPGPVFGSIGSHSHLFPISRPFPYPRLLRPI